MKERSDLKQLTMMLKRRTSELATSNRHLQRGIVRRKTVEAALKISAACYVKLLRESLGLQKNLRTLTHQVLAAQEEERKKISHELQDEIAQTLLGITVRLISLKEQARKNTGNLKKDIASTQRLVTESARSVRRFKNA